MRYVVPELEVLKMDVYDVICASGDGIIPGVFRADQSVGLIDIRSFQQLGK